MKRENNRPNERRGPQPNQWFILAGRYLLMVRRVDAVAVTYDTLDRQTGHRVRGIRQSIAEWRKASSQATPCPRFVRWDGGVPSVRCIDGMTHRYMNADTSDLDESPPVPGQPSCPACALAYAQLREGSSLTVRLCEECRFDAIMERVSDFEKESGQKFTSSVARHVALRIG